MIQDNLKVGMIVAFKHKDEVIRGVLHAWDEETKEYAIKITHGNGERFVSSSNKDIAAWGGKILGLVQ